VTDLFDKCREDEGNFGPQRPQGDGNFFRPALDSVPGARMNFQGHEMVMWSVNNYLGLAQNQEIKEAALQAIQTHSVSAPMGSRMMSGTTSDHIELERRLAEYSQKEAAILFNYGYMGVMGTIASLTSPDDVVVMDRLSHACIVDGSMVSKAHLRVYKHNDMNSLEKVLKRVNRDRKGGVLIVGEGTYGMTGDLAKLPELCALKDKYGARLFLDDAHGIGVLGEQGRGTADHFGVQDKIDVYFGTFAKSFASIGGFSASQQKVVDWIHFNARPQVFAKSLPMIYVKTLLKALDLVTTGDERRKKMWEMSEKLKTGLRDLGFYIGDGESPICAVFTPMKDRSINEVAPRMIQYLRDRGVFVTGIIYPVIPLGLLMFRMIPTATHTDADIQLTLEAFKDMKAELQLDTTMDGQDLKNVKKLYV
jgi:glycine C-acetyltransferase